MFSMLYEHQIIPKKHKHIMKYGRCKYTCQRAVDEKTMSDNTTCQRRRSILWSSTVLDTQDVFALHEMPYPPLPVLTGLIHDHLPVPPDMAGVVADGVAP